MSDELLPCPHCGSDKVLVIGMADKPLDCYRWHVECQECHCTGRHFHRDEGARREMAVAAWNRRVPGVGVPAEDAWWLFQTKREVAMVNDKYAHRNGETDAPTESGWYWFSGESDDVMHAGLIHVVCGIKLPEAWPTWSDGWSYLSEYQGQWWGPIVPPWRE